MTNNLLKSLINASEKAANIARRCRADKTLLELLVQEKSTAEANPRFVQDFKTLADVLIQETIRHDVGKLFPELAENIKGEETSSFTNILGETVCVSIGEDRKHTADGLERVLDGNRVAAEALAKEVHRNVDLTDPELIGDVPELPSSINLSNIGIWIDPIDATAEYIAGETVFSGFPGITSTGLDCVTVLIGAYEKDTGVPVLGIVNQPFHTKEAKNSYKSKIFWGVSLGNFGANNICQEKQDSTRIAVFSSSEKEEILELVKGFGFELAFSAGAGHKALKVITGEADLYLLSKGSTFKWDTCAPQAILQSLNGGMFDYKKSIGEKDTVPVSYAEDQGKCNEGGLIAFSDASVVRSVLDELFK